MKKIVLFDPTVATLNIGDFIIKESTEEQLKEILNNSFKIYASTHQPTTHAYQNIKRRKIIQFFDNANYKFLLGTNIIKKNMFYPFTDWNVNIFNYRPYKNTILVGAGLDNDFKKVNIYTKYLYKKILSKEYIHSTRDEKTKDFLESLGFKAINTGCATLWGLNEEFCKKIKTTKAKDVVFTLTDYNKDIELDQKLIDILSENYDNLYFFVQGAYDLEYLHQLNIAKDIKLIDSNIKSYQTFLKNHDVDYIGTRLHAGIYAMNNKKRTIIIEIDNRCKDMKETYNLNTIKRKEIDTLKDMIYTNIKTKININEKNIKNWKKQFK